jgi:ubiquinone/menaquinone biosynthesis C-methylase UbiE
MHERHGAKQPKRFNPERAAQLDDQERFNYLPVDDVMTLLDAPPGARLLDFGTGTGTYAIALARRRPDLHIVALDEQPQMLALLQEKLQREPLANIEPALGSGESLSAFDRVLALNVLHEAGDQALQSIRRALRGQGQAVFIDWNGEVERPAGPPRDHVYTIPEARERLATIGFAILSERLFPYHYAMVVTPDPRHDST